MAILLMVCVWFRSLGSPAVSKLPLYVFKSNAGLPVSPSDTTEEPPADFFLNSLLLGQVDFCMDTLKIRSLLCVSVM